uniref:GPI ethanolamine phosphate transferase 1 n=1 Tax=Anopheles farauti TaxID=69004 RepID=A0A2C9GW79_9DIPT
MKLLFVAVVIHVLFLLSIFYIHFQSPILKGLPDGAEHDQPPADRLVLFVGDGLRAESFLKYNLNRTTFLRNILLERGVFGISSTRVPTESRPGHAALLGGVYEDPSAVFRGWKENPVEFDSVLNRSSVSYCWGSPDIVHMFSRGATPGRVHVASYESDDESFAQSANTSLLDIWVFDRVRAFLAGEVTKRDVLAKKKVILFLHLLGLDTAGHVHKPHSDLFTENLITVDRGIESIVEQIERITENDGRTAYIFTSDHGMTDQGSHGAGDPHETETPFLAWGAGINNWQRVNPSPGSGSILEVEGRSVPVHHIRQADAAPLMASVLGISVPKNSLGKLPRSLLNVSEEYAAWAMQNNANQLLTQYYRWQHESESKMLQWLTSTKQTSLKVLIEALQKEIADAANRKQYNDVQSLCKMLMDTTLTAIEYFQNYYKPHLFLALTLTMFGWLLLLAKETFKPTANRIFAVSRSVAIAAMVFATVVVIFNVAQNTPQAVILYFVVPIVVWGYIGSQWRSYAPLLQGQAVMYFVGFVIAAEALVLAFMDRRLLAPLLWIHCLLVIKPLLVGKALNVPGKWMALRWVVCNVLLSGFFVLTTIGRDNSNVLLLCGSIFAWTAANIIVVYRTKHSSTYKGVIAAIHVLQACNYLLVVYFIEISQAIPQWSRWLCWIFTVLGMLTPLYTTTSIADRILGLISGLSGPYMMLSLSYEPLFLLCFCCTIYHWIAIENTICNGKTTLDQLNFTTHQLVEGKVTFSHTRRTFGFMLFLLASFFGTGNLATVSSFDPNWVRCFVSTFAPFTMMALIILKLLIPVLLLICVLKAMVIVTSVAKTKMFNLTLIVCDWMCLNFFFLVRNEGSWMEIGSSISHFVILECTTIVVMMLYELARLVTEASFGSKPSRTRQTPDNIGLPLQFLPYSNKERIE